jgi:hypothetical protein
VQPEVDVEAIGYELQSVGDVGVQGCIRQFGESTLAQRPDAGGEVRPPFLRPPSQKPSGYVCAHGGDRLADSPA